MDPITISIITALAKTALPAGVRLINNVSSYKIEEKKLKAEIDQFERTRADRLAEQEKYYQQNVKDKILDRFLNNSWPLNLEPEELSLQTDSDGKIPLRVFFVTPDISNEKISTLFEMVNRGILAFLNRNWGTGSSYPVLLYNDGWKNNDKGMTSILYSLRKILNGQPTLVLFPKIIQNSNLFILYGSFWGIGNTRFTPQIFELLSIDLLANKKLVAKEQAKKWRDLKKSLIGLDITEINKIATYNLEVLQQEENLIGKNISDYEINKFIQFENGYDTSDEQTHEIVSEFISSNICAIISVFADIYFCLEYKEKSLLPYVLTNITYPYYMDSITTEILQIHNALIELTDSGERDSLSIELIPLRDVITIISNLLAESVPDKQCYVADFTLRLLWDERLSEYFKEILYSYNRNYDKAHYHKLLYKHIGNLINELDSSVNKDGIDSFVEKLLNYESLPTFLFSYSYRHKEIIEVTNCQRISSYIAYRTLDIDGGINWLIGMNLAQNISQEVFDKYHLIRPSNFIENNSEYIHECLTKILRSRRIQVADDKVQKLSSDPLFLANVRIVSDIIYRGRGKAEVK